MADKGRPKRRCVQKKQMAPSAVHYVGYVEDFETPEEIMQKFHALNECIASANPEATNEALGQEGSLSAKTNPNDGERGENEEGNEGAEASDRLLLEVFRRTSCLNVPMKSIGDGEGAGTVIVMMDSGDGEREDRDSDSSYGSSASDGGIDEDDEDEKGRRGAGASQKPRWRLKDHGKGSREGKHLKHHILLQYNRDTNALIRRKVTNEADADGSRPALGVKGASKSRDGTIFQLRVPAPPLPTSWGRTVKPYDPLDPVVTRFSQMMQSPQPQAALTPPSGAEAYFETQNLPAFVTTSIESSLLKPPYVSVLINSGWEGGPGSGDLDYSKVLERLKQVPLLKLCPTGFIFIWAHKLLIHPITKHLYSLGFGYVENLTWVWSHPNNKVVQETSSYARRSHLTLLIYRKENEGKDIELKHQRNADVVFDCIQACPGYETSKEGGCGSGAWKVPREAYHIIETMLPGHEKFIELWSISKVKSNQARKRWTMVHECKT